MSAFYTLPQADQRFYNQFFSIFNRAFNGQVDGASGCNWQLARETLAYFIMNFTLLGGPLDIHIEVSGSIDLFIRMVSGIDTFRMIDETTYLFCGTTIHLHRIKEIREVIEVFPADYDRVKMRIPINTGTRLDEYDINWCENTRRNPKPKRENVFFDDERLKNGHDLLIKLLECGRKVGIEDKMFMAFGNLLGYVITGDFLPNDDDIDINILADDMDQDQRHEYFVACKKAGLMENRERGPVDVEDNYVWFSLGPKSPYHEHGVKACNWFWFKHGGYWWHSKGEKWTGHRDLDKKFPTAKGIHENVFTGELRKINFSGIEINAPKYIGKCLDAWYGNWTGEKNCSSEVRALLVMPDYNRQNWYIKI